MTVEDRKALAEAEPLFTLARTAEPAPGSGEHADDPWEPGDERWEPAVRLSLVDALMDSLSGPVLELGPAPIGFTPPPPMTLEPRDAGRKGMVKGFRHWWRQESLARAAQKRAFAMAETILRSQAAQLATGPIISAPAAGVQAQSIRSMLELTEERFQALGLRSDRVQDELSAIARGLEEMRGQIAELIALQRSR